MRTGHRKRRVMHIGYDYNPWEVGRGGVIVYQWSIMKGLVRRGWDVSFFMGSRHTLFGKTKNMGYLRDGVKVIELINSPRRHLDFHCDPLAHLKNRVIEEISETVFSEEQPDVIHIHDPRLLTVSVIDIIKACGIPVIKTVHNYFDLCPQGEFFFRGESICTDDQNGKKCRECMSSLPEESFMKERISNTFRGSFIHPYLKRLWRIMRNSNNPDDNHGSGLLPYPEESYRTRRNYCLERLRMLDVIHCYSTRSCEILMDYGVPDDKMVVIPISSDSIRDIHNSFPSTMDYPVVFGYLTGQSRIKGYELILEAFSMIDQSKAKLIAYGFDEPQLFQKKYRHLNAEFHGSYRTGDLNHILGRIHVGLVPSIWEEVFGIVGIEFLAAGVPVIGSDIGGIPEWLKDRENGLLVRVNDSRDLLNKMEMCINDMGIVSEMSRNIRLWKSMEDHVKEIEELYESLL